jgi:hypothetical protein
MLDTLVRIAHRYAGPRWRIVTSLSGAEYCVRLDFGDGSTFCVKGRNLCQVAAAIAANMVYKTNSQSDAAPAATLESLLQSSIEMVRRKKRPRAELRLIQGGIRDRY